MWIDIDSNLLTFSYHTFCKLYKKSFLTGSAMSDTKFFKIIMFQENLNFNFSVLSYLFFLILFIYLLFALT